MSGSKLEYRWRIRSGEVKGQQMKPSEVKKQWYTECDVKLIEVRSSEDDHDDHDDHGDTMTCTPSNDHMKI